MHVELSDRFVDLVGEGFDLAIRIGHLEDSSLVARRLSDVPMVLVGAPILLAEYGTPKNPEDLVDIPLYSLCIGTRDPTVEASTWS